MSVDVTVKSNHVRFSANLGGVSKSVDITLNEQGKAVGVDVAAFNRFTRENVTGHVDAAELAANPELQQAVDGALSIARHPRHAPEGAIRHVMSSIVELGRD